VARGVLVRWGDSIQASIPATVAPGDLLTGPQDLVAIPRIEGAGSPRIWMLNTSTLAPEDPNFPIWLLRLRAYLGVGSTARQVVWDLPFFGNNGLPTDIFQTTFGAVDVRISGELYLAPYSSSPSVLRGAVQTWVTCSPFSPYSATEALP